MKKKIAIYAAALSLLMSPVATPKAHALLLGAATVGAVPVLGYICFGYSLYGFGITGYEVASGKWQSGMDSVAALTGIVTGVIFDESGNKIAASVAQVKMDDLGEKVDLGIYTAAQAGAIRSEINALDAHANSGQVKIDVRGKNPSEIRSLIAQNLRVSDLTASYLATTVGVQTE